MTGSVTPARSARTVRLSTGESESGPWLPGPEVLTDSTGDFAAAVKFDKAGEVWIRAIAETLDRDQEATSSAVKATVRAITSLTIDATTTAGRTDKPLTFTGTSTPAQSTVVLETSADGGAWSKVGVPVDIGATGHLTVKITSPPAGTLRYRFAAKETDTATSGQSEPLTVTVDDYKAAAAQYTKILDPLNAAIRATDRAESANNGSASTFDALAIATGKQADALTKAAEQLRQYEAWPVEVSALVVSFAKHMVIEADGFNLASQAKSMEEFGMYIVDVRGAQSAGYRESAEIRDALGLPKRSS